MKTLYLVAAVVGAVVPFYFYFQHFELNGMHPMDFVDAALVGPATRGLTADLVISSIVFWAFMIHRRLLGHGPRPTAYIVLTVLIGLACAVPAYLYAMEAGRRIGAEAGA
jgi:hypothetical protein